MSKNPSLPESMGPMTIGNVVSAGLVLYRSHFKPYLSIALFAYLWILLPILLIIPVSVLFTNKVLPSSALWLIIPAWLVLFLYCIAQYLTNSALIARLGYANLISKPETINDSRKLLNRRAWSFLWQGLLIGLLLLVAYIIFAIVGGILGGIIGFIFGLLAPTLGKAASALGVLITVGIIVIIVLLGISVVYARFIIADVVLAVEDGSKVVESISRSWELTKASTFRIMGVVLVASLVTFPILFVISYIPQILMLNVERGSTAFWTLYFISLVLSMGTGVLIKPFWQTVKAVIYYDLRSRREGLGLQLRDSDNWE
jgi:hypothetical protein